MKNFTPQIYQQDDFTNWKQHLDQEGYVVICNVLQHNQINTGIEHFWKDWNTVSPGFIRNDPKTWSINTAPIMFAKGMAVFNGFGQCDFMWFLRTQQPFKNIFSNVHGTEDLITSFDGFSVFFSKKQKSPKDWFHIDQHPDNPDYTVQGAYNFFPVNEDSAGFTVVPKSHRTFQPSSTKVKKDWIQIHSNKSAEETAEIISQAVKLLIPGNCFVLWNSKTIHANTGMTCKTDPETLDRLTAYITFIPRSRRTNQAQLEKRKEAYLNGNTTSHWPNKVEIKVYPWGFGPTYERRNYKKIEIDSNIPQERLDLF
jgi:ectoine hydroxylase-related dioxygenase (phytanoyl-CoA dioxygenase family)